MEALEVKHLQSQIEQILCPHGFEVHPFLVGWYNDQVSPKFHMDLPPATLAFTVISQPAMFEKALLPFLSSQSRSGLHDPIDECMLHYFSKLHDKFPSISTLHDFQLSPSRRPKVLVQTAGHVAGAVRFYKPQDYPQLGDKKHYPVCHHPVWGGWFALRGVVIFTELRADMERVEPPSVLSDDQAVDLIKLYNDCWQDWRWRDVGREKEGEKERYSEQQIKYFETLPAERFKMIDSLVQGSCPC
eukprot:GFUD01021027.1.p1 GENE.GFUD01021027.1~~GFUD01021027.1.p1  ORF type:complete len:244 (+),score=75.15 GFUD01021027.1:40-771(+)